MPAATAALILNDPRVELARKLVEEASQVLLANLPALKQLTGDVLEAIFIPRAVAKQLALLIALDFGLVTVHQVTSLIAMIGSQFSSHHRLVRSLQNQQNCAQTQDEWMDLAERIDAIQLNDVWRSDPNCPLYERDRISARIDELVHLMRRQDIFELMFVLRGSINRNKFGLLHEGLFSKALAGTKVLVETYHNVVCAALDFCCDAPVAEGDEPIPTDARLAFFNETRHAYGRTALLLSGGAALGFYHIGVVKTLMENRLMPRVIGGSSAGSIVCAMLGTRTDEECMNDFFNVEGTDAPGHTGKMAIEFFRPLRADGSYAPTQSFPSFSSLHPPPKPVEEVFNVWNNSAAAFTDVKRTIQGLVPIPLRHFTSLLYDLVTGNRRPHEIFKNDTDHFRKCVRNNVGNFTFQEAFDRTGRICNIVVTPNNPSDPPRLLNYLTAPHVLVWSAAVASSSLPGVFEANRLVVKEADGWERYESGGGHHFDGSMEQDLPMQQLSEMFNVNHFVISQANPHAVMFATYNTKTGVWNNSMIGFAHSIVSFLKDQVRSWLSHLVHFIGARRIAPLFSTNRTLAPQFFTQEYEGRPSDISLIPWLNHRGLISAMLHIIYNPSVPEFKEWIDAGAREAWRHIPAIKSHIAEEITLDLCVQRLRRRLMIESWEREAQKHAATTPAGNNKSNSMSEKHRVPSFFTSPSLVNLGGLNVADVGVVSAIVPPAPAAPAAAAAAISTVPDQQQQQVQQRPRGNSFGNIVPVVDINSGWGGMGLKGNRSSGNLAKASSVASGLFIDDEHDDEHDDEPAGGEDESSADKAAGAAAAATTTTTTAAPETTTSATKVTTTTTATADQQQPLSGGGSSHNMLRGGQHADEPEFTDRNGYIKTTSMAQFYYRHAKNSNSVDDFFGYSNPTTQQGGSLLTNNNDIPAGGVAQGNVGQQAPHHQRKKSKSFAEFSSSTMTSPSK